MMKVVRLVAGFVMFWLILLRDLLFSFLRCIFNTKPTPNTYLSENWGPIGDELYAAELPVKGVLPDDLDGEFVRNGPNPRFDNSPIHDLTYHWFDGDGMLHGVNVQNGSATYVNRYVRTARWQEEDKEGKRLHFRLGDFLTPLGVLSLIGAAIIRKIIRKDPLLGRGTANTAVEFHDGRLLALVESDAPYHVQMPNLATVGKHTYNGALKHPFTAHPKVDAKTGELLCFGYRLDKAPYVQYSVVSKEGELVSTIPIDIEVPVMMHDFAITQNYSIFMDLPFTFRPERIVGGRSPFAFESNRGSRFGILPRHATKQSEIKWFKSSACFVFHVANCYEEGNEVVLVACRSEATSSLGLDAGPDPSHEPYLYRWRFNMDTGKVKEVKLGTFQCEFPRIHEDLIGYKNRYAYVMRFQNISKALIDAVVKCDFGDGQDNEIRYTTYEFGKGKSAGECVFVPKKDAEAEDDGYLITFVYDDNTNSSEFIVLDATKLDDKEEAVVARVPLPRRVPYGFHGKWITREQIEHQRLH